MVQVWQEIRFGFQILEIRRKIEKNNTIKEMILLDILFENPEQLDEEMALLEVKMLIRTSVNLDPVILRSYDRNKWTMLPNC